MPIPQDCQSPIEIYVGGGCVGVRGGFQQMVSISNCITAQTKYIQSEITDAQQKCHQRRNLSTAKLLSKWAHRPQWWCQLYHSKFKIHQCHKNQVCKLKTFWIFLRWNAKYPQVTNLPIRQKFQIPTRSKNQNTNYTLTKSEQQSNEPQNVHHGKKKESENAKGRLLGKTITITITGCSDDQKLHLGKRKEHNSTTIYVKY